MVRNHSLPSSCSESEGTCTCWQGPAGCLPCTAWAGVSGNQREWDVTHTPASEPQVRAEPVDVAWGGRLCFQLCFTDRHLPFRKEPWLVWGSGKQVAELDFEARLVWLEIGSFPTFAPASLLSLDLCQELGDYGEQVKPCFVLGSRWCRQCCMMAACCRWNNRERASLQP